MLNTTQLNWVKYQLTTNKKISRNQSDLSKFANNTDEIDKFVNKLADDEAKERKECLKWQSKAIKLKLKRS